MPAEEEIFWEYCPQKRLFSTFILRVYINVLPNSWIDHDIKLDPLHPVYRKIKPESRYIFPCDHLSQPFTLDMP